MDHLGEKNKKRSVSSDDQDHENSNSNSKRTCPLTGFEADQFVAKDWDIFFRLRPYLTRLVKVEVERLFHSFQELRREQKEKGQEAVGESEIEKFKLVFCNEICPITFTNNEIRAQNDEILRVSICDATNNIICTGPLSSARIKLFLLNGDYDSSKEEGTHSDFNKSILSQRYGKKPLIEYGNDQSLTLENGVGLIMDLSIRDNSSWTKSRMFRLGAKVICEKNLAKFLNIEIAISQPFRVMDHRGKGNQKHHPPCKEDELWRLEGIGKEGIYHKNLSSVGIVTVGDFLNSYHEIGPTNLKKLLGTKVPQTIWNVMINNALEIDKVPNYKKSSEVTKPNIELVNSLGDKVMGADEAFNEINQAFEQNDLGFESPSLYFNPEDFGFYEDLPPLFAGEASTSYGTTTETLTSNTNKDLGSSFRPSNSRG